MTGGAGPAVDSILVFGETVVDLVRRSGRTGQGHMATFTAYPGGSAANVTVAMTRLGAPAVLMSGAGNDEWGAALRTWLEREGVDLRWFVQPPGAVTPVSLISLGRGREPTIYMHCEALGPIARECATFHEAALETARAVYFASNTLIGATERELTMTLRQKAIDLGMYICFDVNLRTGRWASLDRARALCQSVIPKATLVKCNLAEAQWLTGRAEPAEAADAIHALGAENVVVTLGPDGAWVRGASSALVPPVRAQVRSTLGAGDAFIATAMARLAVNKWQMSLLPDAVRDGVRAAAQVTEHWGAVSQAAGTAPGR